MFSADRPGPADRTLLAAGTAAYDCSDFEALDQVPEALRSVVATLTGLGFSAVAENPGYAIDPTVDDLRAAVERAAAAAPVVVVYYTGHGIHPERDTYYLVTKQSQPERLRQTALQARDLPALLIRRDEQSGMLADQPMVLVILDCCFSGAAGTEILAEGLREIGNPNTWVIASAGMLEYAQQGLFAKAFCDAVQRPTIGASQVFVSLDTIVQAVNTAHPGATQRALLFTPPGGYGGVAPFFANPAYRSGVAGLTVPEQHWLSRVRGGPEESTTGFYLTGRTGRLRAAQHLAAWIADPGPGGLAIVTGSPGTGKSALLALPVLLTQPAVRTDLLRRAEPGSLVQRTADLLPLDTQIVAVHVRGLNTDQVAGAIAQALGRAPRTAAALLDDLDAAPEPAGRVVAVDAVDEAASPAALLTSLLLPLARQPGLRVAVAGRRHVVSGVGEAELTIDLDSGQYQDPQALTDYVHRLLVASEEPGVITPYQSTAGVPGYQDQAVAVAAAIARRATASDEGTESFLIGRLLALSVRGRADPVDISSPGWQSELPASIAGAFDQDLARLGGNEHLARTLLAALAWAKGPGLPWESVWARVAQRLAEHDGSPSPPGSGLINDDGIRWLLEQAGAYVVEDLGPGQRSVYRPFHDLLAAHLRGAPGPRPADADPAQAGGWRQRRARTEKTITDALLGTLPAAGQARDWGSAHPYLRTYLAQHAAAAGTGTLAALARDPGFLAVTDPVTLTPLLSVIVPELRVIARTYRRARPLLGDDPHANAAYLNEAACALTGTAAPEAGGVRPLYRTYLASVASAQRDDSLLTLTGHTDQVDSVAFGAGPDGRLLLASGSRDGTVRVWDPVTGAPAGRPLTGHAGAVNSVAFGAGPDGRLLLASGGEDRTVRVWDPATGAPVGEPLAGHTDQVWSVAFGAGSDGRLLLASGSWDKTVRVWDPVTGAPAGEPLTGHTGAVWSVAFGSRPDGRLVLASGSYDKTVRLWEPVIGTPVGRPLAAHTSSTDWVVSVALGTEPGGRLLLACGTTEGAVRLWDPVTGTRVGPLAGRVAGWAGTVASSPAVVDRMGKAASFLLKNPVRSLAFGSGPDGRLLLASGGGHKTVRAWDPVTGTSVGEPLAGHTDRVWSVAFGAGPDGRLLLASGSEDRTVRVWDPFVGAQSGKPLAGHTERVWSVAFGAGPDGRLLLASGSQDKTLRLWDPVAGAQVGKPLTGAFGKLGVGWMSSAAFGTGPDGRSLLASGSGDNYVRLWDPVAASQAGEQPAAAQVASWVGKQVIGDARTIKVLTGHTDPVTSVAFGAGPDGRVLLASGSQDKTVRLWDPLAAAQVGKPLTHRVARSVGDIVREDPVAYARVGKPLTGHTDAVNSVAFGAGPDGRLLLASGSGDKTVRLWAPATGTQIGKPLTGHTDAVNSVAFGAGPDGRLLLASGSGDKTVRLWEPATGFCIAAIHRRSSVHSVAMTGVTLAIGDDEGVSVIELTWPITSYGDPAAVTVLGAHSGSAPSAAYASVHGPPVDSPPMATSPGTSSSQAGHARISDSEFREHLQSLGYMEIKAIAEHLSVPVPGTRRELMGLLMAQPADLVSAAEQEIRDHVDRQTRDQAERRDQHKDRPKAQRETGRRPQADGEPDTQDEARNALRLAEQLQQQGDAAGARAAYQKAIDSGHPEHAPAAALNLGNLLSEEARRKPLRTGYFLLLKQGDAARARAAYQKAIDSGHPEHAPAAALSLGIILEEVGLEVSARAAYQKAIDSGHPEHAASARERLLKKPKKRGFR
jgi:WD40 repeat protein